MKERNITNENIKNGIVALCLILFGLGGVVFILFDLIMNYQDNYLILRSITLLPCLFLGILGVIGFQTELLEGKEK